MGAVADAFTAYTRAMHEMLTTVSTGDAPQEAAERARKAYSAFTLALESDPSKWDDGDRRAKETIEEWNAMACKR